MEDTELAESFGNMVKTVPKEFVAQISNNPTALRNFANQIKSGIAQKVIPLAVKEQMLKGGDFMTHYAEIGRRVYNEDKISAEERKDVRKKDPRAEKLRKRASNKKGSSKGTKTSQTADDIWEMSSEEFNKKYM
jgi:hypothetical protein